MPNVSRQTLRKKIIHNLFWNTYKGNPVLLEEFRWGVYCEERTAQKEPIIPMSRSYRHSFNCTLRKHSIGIQLYKSPLKTSRMFSGIVAQAAVYRLLQKGRINSISFDSLVRIYIFRETMVIFSPLDPILKKQKDKYDFQFRPSRKFMFLTCLCQVMHRKSNKKRVIWQEFVSFPNSSYFTFISSIPPDISIIRKGSNVPWDLHLLGYNTSYKVPGMMPVGPYQYRVQSLRKIINLPEEETICRRNQHRFIYPFTQVWVNRMQKSTHDENTEI